MNTISKKLISNKLTTKKLLLPLYLMTVFLFGVSQTAQSQTNNLQITDSKITGSKVSDLQNNNDITASSTEELNQTEEPLLPMINYGEKNLTSLSDQLTYLATRSHSGADSNQNNIPKVHIVQIGDSHTAADFFTGQVRKRFQQDYGDAGIGFVNPVKVSGQRYANISVEHDKNTWEVLSGRIDRSDEFTLGGFIATPIEYVEPEDPELESEPKSEADLNSTQITEIEKEATNSTLSLKLWTANKKPYQAKLLYSSSDEAELILKDETEKEQLATLEPTQNNWQFSDFHSITFPLEVSVPTDKGLKLGAWYIKNDKPGVIFSTIGSNGATIAMLDKWQPDWVDTLASTNPNMVILSYGTNEAFNDDLNIERYEQRLNDKILTIREKIPQTVILIIGASDSIKTKPTSDLSDEEIITECPVMQPKNLNTVIEIQRSMAKKHHTLFWDWRMSMGGECSIIAWNKDNKAQNDLIHLSISGYKKSADDFYQDLKPQLIGDAESR